MLQLIQGIKKAKEEEIAYYYPNAHNFKMEWAELIDVLFKLNPKFELTKNCQCNHFSHMHKDERFNGHFEETSMLTYNKFDPVIFFANNYFNAGEKIKNFILNNTEGLYKDKNFPASIKIIVNMAGKEGNDSGIHKDVQPVMSFQLTGNCKYRVFKNVPEGFNGSEPDGLEYITYDLNPGTLIFIPKGVYHQVLISEPRITAVAEFL